MKDEEQDIGMLLMKYLEGTADAIETESAENWIAESEEHFDEARRLYMLLLAADVRDFSDTMGIESRLARAKGKIRSRRRKADLWKWLQRSAAILFIPVTISLFALLYHYTSGYEPQMLTVSTNPGMTASFRLPDSTLVCLNSGSTLTYPSHFTDGQRSVSLRGEAYFEVTKDAERRFVLSMPEGTEIEVLGTKFNAEAYDDLETVKTTLVEGSVNFRFMKAGKQRAVRIRPGQKVIYDKQSGNVSMRATSGLSELSWKDGKIVFDNTPFEESLEMLEKRFNVSFEVKERKFYDYSFTGTFVTQRLEQILDYFRISSNIRWRYLREMVKNEEKMIIEIY